MNNFKANIKQKYNISNYQAEQIIFVIKSLGSELSKMLIMGILFRNEILLFLFQLIFMCFLRSFSGGFHFYSYWSCLLASVLYMRSLIWKIKVINRFQLVCPFRKMLFRPLRHDAILKGYCQKDIREGV